MRILQSSRAEAEVVTLSIDGAARGNPGPAGYGIVASDEKGRILARAYGFIGEQTNNVAEYCALLAALNLAALKGWDRIKIRSDSELLVKQIKGVYKVKSQNLAPLHRRAKVLISRLKRYSIAHVARGGNKPADKLANKGVDKGYSRPKEINPIQVKERLSPEDTSL